MDINPLKIEEISLMLANHLENGITVGHDWPNTDDELLRLQSASAIRGLIKKIEELEMMSKWHKIVTGK